MELEADRISATGSVMAPKLPLRGLSAWFQFPPPWPSFGYSHKWNLVLAGRRSPTVWAVTWSSSGFIIRQLSCRPSTRGIHWTCLQLISLSCLNRPCRSCTVVVYRLQFVGIDTLIFGFGCGRNSPASFSARFSYGLIIHVSDMAWFWLRPKRIKTVSVGLYLEPTVHHICSSNTPDSFSSSLKKSAYNLLDRINNQCNQ